MAFTRSSPISWLLAGLLLPLGLGGCNDDSGSDTPVTPPVQAQPECLGPIEGLAVPAGSPQVLYTSRSHDSIDAATNSLVVAAFTAALDPNSIDANSITVRNESGTAVTGRVRYDSTLPGIVFDPAELLAGNQRYSARLSTSIKSSTGQPLSREYCWQFKVAGARRDTEEQRQIQIIVDQSTEQYDIPGTAMSIRYPDGTTWSTTSGYADLTTRQPMTANTRFRIGSNTKPLVATAILQLAGAGRVGLDDPATKTLGPVMQTYLPTYNIAPITVRNLLQHTSGLGNFTTNQTWGTAFESQPMAFYHPYELLQYANNVPNRPAYGTFSYSNTNYVLLGLMLPYLSGTLYEEAVEEWVLRPHGLNGTSIPRMGDITLPTPFSRGYYVDSLTGLFSDVTIRDPSTVWSSGDVISTTEDLAKIATLLGRGTLLTPAMQQQRMQFIPFTGESNLSYGLGIVRDNGANLIGHQGGMIGYTSQMYYVPDKDVSLSFFYNRTLAMPDYSAVMTYKVLQKLWPTRPVPASSVMLRQEAAYAGEQRRPGFLTEY
ncbi:serine hydrolase [Chitinimonas lacunae]|uniref:Serine hydrolase n=1 Tax=Chitinimonas lacunae TaxID=1963018 RepID=A0ABV8MQH5_9NEIS